MKTPMLRQMQEEAVAIETGKMAPGRVWRVTKRPDGTMERKQLNPETFRRARAKENSHTALALTVRRKLGVSQDRFAEILGISAGTLRNWEQKRNQPTGATALLLYVAEQHPEIVREVANKVRRRRAARPALASIGTDA